MYVNSGRLLLLNQDQRITKHSLLSEKKRITKRNNNINNSGITSSRHEHRTCIIYQILNIIIRFDIDTYIYLHIYTHTYMHALTYILYTDTHNYRAIQIINNCCTYYVLINYLRMAFLNSLSQVLLLKILVS